MQLKHKVNSYDSYESKVNHIEADIENVVPYFNYRENHEDLEMAGIKSKYKKIAIYLN
tara:strand:+ start:207 stop:380 length:174 start_codon:yes stop_codon:yes gene_type:complete